jgi:hypothetical protein
MLAAGAAHHALVFARGCGLGAPRVLRGTCRGTANAPPFLELPILPTASWFASRCIMRRGVTVELWARLLIGAIALTLPIVGKRALSVLAMGAPNGSTQG